MVATAHANGVKVLVCLGGPYNNGDLNAVTASPTLRAALVNNLKNLVNTYNLDGIDIDWESGPDPNIYAQFVKELKTAMPDKIISVIGVFMNININPSAEPYVDIVNIMSYDYWVPTYGATEYGDLSQVSRSMNLWAAGGFPKSKLVMGIPLRTYPWGSWSSIVDNYNPPSYANSAGGYTFNGIDLVKQKANFVRDNGFGGFFFYELSLDKWNDSRSLVRATN